MSHELESLKDFIAECKTDAVQRVAEAVISLLENAGFTADEFLDGLAGYFDSRNCDGTTRYIEQAAEALRRETKAKDDEATAPTAK